jgi:hypothetical protein
MDNFIQENEARKSQEQVWLDSDSALKKGAGVCYERDYVSTAVASRTATDGWGGRGNIVEPPNADNNRDFAGVADADYPAVTGGQFIIINKPGSVCEISNLLATTINSTKLTCLASTGGNGLFHTAGFGGRGTAKALQTMAAITDATGIVDGVISSSLDGTATLSTDGLTLTSTGGQFTYAKAGDKVHILAGTTTAASLYVVTPGEYTIESVTSINIVVLTSAVHASSLACVCSFVLVRGNPTVLAYLEDGKESGLAEWITPHNTAAGATHIVTAMVDGVTRVFGGNTMAADSTDTLADGTVQGEQKMFRCYGAITTSEHVVTVTTGKQLDSATALQTFDVEAAGEFVFVEWTGTFWMLISYTGSTLT